MLFPLWVKHINLLTITTPLNNNVIRVTSKHFKIPLNNVIEIFNNCGAVWWTVNSSCSPQQYVVALHTEDKEVECHNLVDNIVCKFIVTDEIYTNVGRLCKKLDPTAYDNISYKKQNNIISNDIVNNPDKDIQKYVYDAISVISQVTTDSLQQISKLLSTETLVNVTELCDKISVAVKQNLENDSELFNNVIRESINNLTTEITRNIERAITLIVTAVLENINNNSTTISSISNALSLDLKKLGDALTESVFAVQQRILSELNNISIAKIEQ